MNEPARPRPSRSHHQAPEPDPATYRRRRLVAGVLLVLLVVLAAVAWSRLRTAGGDPGGGSGSSSPSAGSSGSAAPSGTAPLTPAQAIVAENARPGTPDWPVPDAQTAAVSELAGYPSRSSIVAGQQATLQVRSTLGDATVSAVRMGSYRGAGGRVVWTSPATTVAPQPEPQVRAGRMVVAGWSPTLTLDTMGWPDGAYLLVLRAGGKGAYVPLTIRPASVAGRLVLVNPTATWQAYNDFGGYSLYKGPGQEPHATAVSFDRPYNDNAQHFLLDEYPYVKVAEEHGLPVAYLTSEDLETPGILTGALGLVSGGHDEYWSVPMRDAVEAARDQGVNLAFLGGNEVYWRVRFEDDQRTLVGYRNLSGQDPQRGPTTTALWRADPSARPENSLTGQLYECYPVTGDWVVTTPDWFGYAGTGVTQGTTFKGVIGVESNRAYPVPSTPASLQVVASAPVSCGQGRSVHTATYYTTASGAGVVAVGTINWANVVGGNAGDTAAQSFARAVTVNVLTAMAAGPMGKDHPAVANLATFGLSTATSSGTGGPAVFGSP